MNTTFLYMLAETVFSRFATFYIFLLLADNRKQVVWHLPSRLLFEAKLSVGQSLHQLLDPALK